MLIEQIRIDMQQAKLAKETVKANILSTLYGEMFNQSKSGKEFTAEDELKIIKKFVKNIDETLALEIPEETKKKLCEEKSVLETYLPKQLSSGEIEKIVIELITEGKVMKDIMAHFKEKFNGQYDGRTVSEIVKSKLG